MKKPSKPLYSRLFAGSALIVLATVCAPASANSQEGSSAAKPIEANHFGEDSYEIRFRADTLIVTPVMNVGLVDSAATVVRGAEARFQTYTNYPSFVERAEIRIFMVGASADSEPFAILNVNEYGTASWQSDEASPASLYFVFRVYDADGKFDETVAHELTLVDKLVPEQIGAETALPREEFGQIDEAARRTINLSGVMATVTGRADVSSEQVFVGGQIVPIAEDGRFAAQQIVSRDDSELVVQIRRDGAVVKDVKQSFAIESDDWFLVGQGDVTIGKSFGSGPSRDVSGDQLPKAVLPLAVAPSMPKALLEMIGELHRRSIRAKSS